MNSLYFLSCAAEQDVDDTMLYLFDENPKAANDFVDALYSAFAMLSNNPFIGHKRDDLTDFPVRFWTFKWHYLVIYRPIKPIEIVRVLSGYRDIINLL